MHLENPFVFLLNFFAEFFNNNYGLAIIVLTIIIRFILLPLFIKQETQQNETQDKMNAMKPVFNELKEKLAKAKTTDEKMKIQLRMQNLYKEHGISIASMGFLPGLLQMPVLIGLYHAIVIANTFSAQAFLWFVLDKADVYLALIVAVSYFIQFKINQLTYKPSNDGPNPFAFFINVFPIFMGFISLHAASGIVLYWVIGSWFMIVYKLIRYAITRKKQ